MTGARGAGCSPAHVGKFRSTWEGSPGANREIGSTARRGLIATGGAEYRPTEYLYGQHPGVLTQLELEQHPGA